VDPLVPTLGRGRFGRLVAGVSSESPHLFFSAAGVSRKSPSSPSPSSSRVNGDIRLTNVELWLAFLRGKAGAGVGKSEVKDPRDRSGWVPSEFADASGCPFKASDIPSAAQFAELCLNSGKWWLIVDG
jgi:hypothetical protein